MNWIRHETVRFGHCDPAGIVFYPRYFEMLQACVEDWFNEALGVDYAELLGPRRIGLPSVSLQADFKRVSRMGDVLEQVVAIRRIGRSSLTLTVIFSGPDGERAVFEQVLVCTDLASHRPRPFPDDVRSALDKHS